MSTRAIIVELAWIVVISFCFFQLGKALGANDKVCDPIGEDLHLQILQEYRL